MKLSGNNLLLWAFFGSWGHLYLPVSGSVVLYWTQYSLRRSLRRARSNERLYQALAERATDDIARELFQLLARNERTRAVRKLSRLFSLSVHLPTGRDPVHARIWRRLLILCGPKMVATYVDWRDRRELELTIAAARIITRLTAPRTRRLRR
jgi:hypothetical protein